MEVLKNLSEHELTSLRDRFLRADNHALTLEEFEEVLAEACAEKPHIDVSKLGLPELFSDIDINGDNTVSWDEFTMFLIDGANSEAPMFSVDEDEGVLKQYSHVHTIRAEDGEIPYSIVQSKYLPKLDKVLKVMRRDKSCRVKLCYPNPTLTTFLEVPRTSDVSVLAAEHVPITNEVHRSGTVAVSYSDSVIRFFETKRSTMPGLASGYEMPLVKETRLLESQTAMGWSSKYNRLVVGSRSGVVSVLDIDQPTVFSKEKLHGLLISDLKLSDTQMFTASLDPNFSVKCVDLQRSVVRYALNGHAQGATLIDIDETRNHLFTAGFELHALVYSMTLPRLKPYMLLDNHRPHRGRIVGLQAVPDSPQVITADSTGLVKVWDLRTYTCVQSIQSNKDDETISTAPVQSAHSSQSILSGMTHLTSVGYIPSCKRLVVNGRETSQYVYEDASSPHLTDDLSLTTAIYNPVSHTFLTIHDRTVKLWNGVTGALRGNHTNALPSDVSAVCLATPLGRRFFAGTHSGELFSVGYALGTIIRQFEHCYRPKLGRNCSIDLHQSDDLLRRKSSTLSSSPAPVITSGPEIVDLHYLERFRDSKSPYVVVAFKQEVVLVPDVEEDVQKSALTLHCLDQVLIHSGVSTRKVAIIKGGIVVVSTTDGRVHVADLANFSLVMSWGVGSLRGEIPGMHIHDLPNSTIGTCAFFGDASGRVTAVLLHHATKWEVVVSWAATTRPRTARIAPEGEDGSAPTPPSRSGSPPASGEASLDIGSVALIDDGCTSSDEEGDVPLANGAVQSYFHVGRKEAFTPAITTMDYLADHHVLATADERGYIALWDVAQYVDACSRRVKGHLIEPPMVRRIRKWRAHDEEIRTITAFQRHGKTLLLSAADDRQVLMWSMDGALLGNLAQGRPEFAQEGIPGRRIYPFLVDDPPAEAWDEFAAYEVVAKGGVDGVSGSGQDGGVLGEGLDATALQAESSLRATPSNNLIVSSDEGGVRRTVLSPSSVDTLGAVFLTETHISSSGFSAATPKPPPLRLPQQFAGVVNKQRALAGGKVPKARDTRKPLMHFTLPAVRGATASPLPDETSPMRPRATSARVPTGPRPPQTLPAPVTAREYVKLGMFPTADTCLAPALTPRAPTFDPKAKEPSSRRARASNPSDGGNPLKAMGAGAREYLRSHGYADDPFESKKDRCLRLGGSVVVGPTETGKSVAATTGETSNRVK